MPQLYATSWSSLLTVLSRPIVMTGLFRDILMNHFQPDNIEEPRLRDIIWSNAPDSKLQIETAHRWKPQTTGARPAIIVKRNRYANIRMGIGNRLMGTVDISGDEHFTTFWSGSHTFFCLGASGAQAEILGSEVQKTITEFADQIERCTGLKRLGVLDVDEVGELEEARENFVVPVTVGYVYEEIWAVSQHGPRLSKISLSTILDF